MSARRERGRAQHLEEERFRAVVAVRMALTCRKVNEVAEYFQPSPSQQSSTALKAGKINQFAERLPLCPVNITPGDDCATEGAGVEEFVFEDQVFLLNSNPVDLFEDHSPLWPLTLMSL